MVKMTSAEQVARRAIASATLLITLIFSSTSWKCAAGAVIVDETFDEPGATVGNTAHNPLSVAWNVVFHTTLSIADDSSGIGDGNTLDVATTQGFPQIAAEFPQVQLGVGDSVKLSFDFRFTQPPAANVEGFRFTLQSTFPPVGTYLFSTGMGGIDGTTWFRYNRVDAAGSGGIGLSNLVGTDTNINDQLPHTASLQITRTAAGDDLIATVDNNIWTASDNSSNPFFNFDRVEIGLGDIATNFRLDNVIITTVPEPSGLLLAMLGGVVFVVGGRRLCGSSGPMLKTSSRPD